MNKDKSQVETVQSDEIDETIDTTEQRINAFAKKLGDETGNDFVCYVYRLVKDEETGRKKKPIVKKYVGVEPDPYEIAQQFRGGSYLIQFIWYKGKSQQSKAFTLDVDETAFPPAPKNNGQLVPVNGSMSENMQLSMTMINAISEVMKAAYTNGNSRPVPASADPLEMFGGLIETMESSFTRAMALNQTIMEKVYLKNMEKKYGLLPEPVETQSQEVGGEDGTIIGRYAPIVREAVEGIKALVSAFGDKVPKAVVQQVTKNDRVQMLLRDKNALVMIGHALRKEFGTEKANELLKLFGVQMVPRAPVEVVQTPPVASVPVNQGSRARGKKEVNKKAVAVPG